MSAWIDELGRLADEYAEHKRNEGIYDASFIAHRQAALAAEEAAEARAALLAHAAQRDHTEDVLGECLASLILTSTAPSAPAAPVEPSEVPIPRPDKVAYSSCGISFHSDRRTIGGFLRFLAIISASFDFLNIAHCLTFLSAAGDQSACGHGGLGTRHTVQDIARTALAAA